MKPPPFTYHRPRTRAEVDALLHEHGSDAKLLAGGQSMVPMLNMRLVKPAHLIDINGLSDESRTPVRGDEAISFGPLVRHEVVESSAVVREDVPLLAEATRLVAHPPIRSRGTLVGAVAHADPASELPPVLVALGGEIQARSSRGTRGIAATDAFAGPFEPAIESDEWIEEVRLPRRRPGDGFAIEEFARRDADYAVCGVVARVRDDDDRCSATLTFFSVGVVAARLTLPPLSHGEVAGPRLPTVVRELVADRLDPYDDVHATADFRRHLAERLATRAVRRATSTIDGSSR